ncbi:MAG: hypothetical protein A2V83_03990 [Nitrospirae bacterium RBG_16_64_22]|nr:MAG: hypothetical protein A2V83_03990 [Nitrospirae bacterium RBG_16_64_22]
MYQGYFHFKEPPFNQTPDPQFFFSTPVHQKVLDAVNQAVERGGGFVIVIGEVGTGKTTLGRYILQKVGASLPVSLVLNPVLPPAELMQTIAEDFSGGEVPIGLLAAPAAAELLVRMPKGGILIIDEAHNLPRSSFDALLEWAALVDQGGGHLTVILLAQPEISSLLDNPLVKERLPASTVRVPLVSLSSAETRAYVGERLRRAGGGNAGPVFTDGGLDAVHRYSRGIPRLVNTVCDKALLAAYVKESWSVDKEHVKLAVEEIEGPSLREERRGRKFIRGVGAAGALSVIVVFAAFLAYQTSRQIAPEGAPDSAAGKRPAVHSRAGVPDEDGVVRASTPEESAAAAAYTLAALWKRTPEDPAAFSKSLGGQPDFAAAAHRLGLEASAVRLSRTAILKGPHPIIVSLLGEPDVITTVRILEERLGKGAADPALLARARTRYAVLAEVHGTNAVVLDPLVGRTSIPVLVLLDRVTGEGTVWSQPPGGKGPAPRLVQERG